jgi:phosphomannomutase
MKNVPETKYNYSLTEEDKVELREVGKLMLEQFNIPHLSNREDQIIDRNSQITYSVIGRTADLEVKKKFDPDSEKRREWVKFLKEHLPQEKYDFRIGGTTSIDITLKGRTKEWGIRQFAAFNKIPLNKIIYLGDKIYPGGNDYEASKIVDCIAVKDHHDALVKMREISMKIKKL